MAAAAPVATWKQDTIQGLERGSRAWYKSSATEWVGVTLLSVTPTECTFITDTSAGPNTGEVRNTVACPNCMSEIHARLAVYERPKQHISLGTGDAEVMLRHCDVWLVQTLTAKPDSLVPANPPVLDGVNDLTGAHLGQHKSRRSCMSGHSRH